MEQRDALKALGTIAEGAGLTVTPVTVGDAQDAALVLLKSRRLLSAEEKAQLAATWRRVVAGTPLEQVRVAVLDADMAFELVKA